MSSYESDDSISESYDSINTSIASCSAPATSVSSRIYVRGDEDPHYFYGANQLDMYETQGVIGSAGGTNIYRGMFHQVGCSEVLTVAYRHLNFDAEDYYNFVIQVKEQRRVNNPNLVALKEEVNDKGRIWLVFEYVGPSLRVMYPDRGASLPVLTYALYITVNALVSIHQKNLVHGQVDVGHIYMQIEPPYDTKLGFGATVYEDIDALRAGPNFLPAWAAAPEVYYNNYLHTSASDIWQVGITALELALGTLWVENREALNKLAWVENREALNKLIKEATVGGEHGLFGNADLITDATVGGEHGLFGNADLITDATVGGGAWFIWECRSDHTRNS